MRIKQDSMYLESFFYSRIFFLANKDFRNFLEGLFFGNFLEDVLLVNLGKIRDNFYWELIDLN